MQPSILEKGMGAGLNAIELMVSASLPVLEIVSVCRPLVCPGLMGPNESVEALMSTAGAETAWPGGGMVANIG